MAQKTISGAQVVLYINGVVYNEVQEIQYTIDYGEEPIYGIDSVFPQEIKITRVSIQGSVSGVRIAENEDSFDGPNSISPGLQGIVGARPQIRDSIFAPYISIRIADRRSRDSIIFIPYARVTNERTSVSAKGIMKTSFSFSGIQGQQIQDRNGLFGGIL